MKKHIACTSFFFTFQGIRKPRRVDADDALIRVLFAGLPMPDCTLRSLLWWCQGTRSVSCRLCPFFMQLAISLELCSCAEIFRDSFSEFHPSSLDMLQIQASFRLNGCIGRGWCVPLALPTVKTWFLVFRTIEKPSSHLVFQLYILSEVFWPVDVTTYWKKIRIEYIYIVGDIF